MNTLQDIILQIEKANNHDVMIINNDHGNNKCIFSSVIFQNFNVIALISGVYVAETKTFISFISVRFVTVASLSPSTEFFANNQNYIVPRLILIKRDKSRSKTVS